VNKTNDIRNKHKTKITSQICAFIFIFFKLSALFVQITFLIGGKNHYGYIKWITGNVKCTNNSNIYHASQTELVYWSTCSRFRR